MVAGWTRSSPTLLWANWRWNYYHYDAQGNCILVTNSDGSIKEQYSYDAFGKPYFWTGSGAPIADLNAYGNRFLFTSREWLADLQLYDYRNRLYHPELGRFIQPDPKEFAAGDYNLYRYCHNDPINHSDPYGLTLNEVPREEVSTITEKPSDFGITKTSLTVITGLQAVAGQNDTYTVVEKQFDLTVTSKVATTFQGRARSAEAIDATKEHEGVMHRGEYRKWYKANDHLSKEKIKD